MLLLMTFSVVFYGFVNELFSPKTLKFIATCSFTSVMFDSVDYSLPGSSVPGIFQATVLEWVAMSSSREPS